MDSQKHSVVIVGGDVGAVRLASILYRDSRYDVTLISSAKSFVHRASLYRDKKGRSKRHITVPFLSVFESRRRDLDLVKAYITKFDPASKIVISAEGIEYKYDSLVVSLKIEGRVLPGFDSAVSYSAYNSSDMNQLRRKLITQFENKKTQENYTVVGAGEAGVEMIAELKLLLNSLSSTYGIDPNSYRVVLVEQANKILPGMENVISSKAMKRLRSMGVDVLVSHKAIAMTDGNLKFDNGKSFNVGLVVVAAGTTANHFYSDNKDHFLLNDDRHVRVTSLLEAEGYSNVYVLGNSKAMERHLGTEGILYEASFVADVMNRKKYGKQIHDYDPPIYRPVIEIGTRWAIYKSVRNHFGRSGWVLKRWRDRKHFSTLLPKRIAFSTWLFGSTHDGIQ